MSKYDLEAIPVVNDKKQLLGRITIDDVLDIIKRRPKKIINWLQEYQKR